LADYDFAAWHATDAVMALHPVGDSALTPSYIVRQEDGGALEAAFGGLDASRDTFFVLYTARQDSAHAPLVARTLTPRRADTGYYARAARALLAARADFGTRSRPYNEAVIPADSGTWWVYRYPAPLHENVWPLGADVRYRVSADGRTIVAKRALHKTILEGPPPAADPKHPGEPPVAGYHSAVFDDLPEDTDVLIVLQRKPAIPEYIVTTAGFIYVVDTDGSIAYRGLVDKRVKK
jgi:hypothetical protein